jgi:GT2 family glycosyltransferase/glycosyltransferase involved in cell wall biosynthesis
VDRPAESGGFLTIPGTSMPTPQRSLDICIATHDIVGPIRNGGIGTAYYALAVALARAGHRVTVLYGLGSHCESRSIEYWRRWYRRLGIRFVPAPDTAGPEVRGSAAVRASYRVYLWLKTQRFDVVHLHEWRGIGYFALLAKCQGLALKGSVMCVGAHSPSFWHKEGMRETPATIEEFEIDFLERESVRLADVVWSPSRHMLEWMSRRGWPRPQRKFVKQYLSNNAQRTRRKPESQGKQRRAATTRIDEFVFFGRLETRKGLDLFCDALDRLAAAGALPAGVLFMGKAASVDGVGSHEYVTKRADRWGRLEWRIESGFDRQAALDYLRGGDRLAVLPSRVDNLPLTVLECLDESIPFLSSDVGGIPEMVAKADRAQVLFPLDADIWGRALGNVLTAGAVVARPAVPFHRTLASWIEWHAQIGRRPARPAHARSTPTVTVCLTHRNRPAFLQQALQSIEQQTYERLEVVLVDDGSDRPDALAFLERIRPHFDRRGWKLVRQPNRFPGAARNTAARHATGKYLLFMDDDNVAKPDEVATLVTAIQTSGADIVSCFLDVFQTPAPPAQESRALFRWTFIGGCASLGAMQNCFGDTNSLMARRVFERLGGFTEDFGIGCEDWELLAKAVLAGYRLQVVPEALVWYRQTGSGVNSTTVAQSNHVRALRPYLEALSPEQRNLLLLAKHQALSAQAFGDAGHNGGVQRLDHVRSAVIFGAGEGGRRAISLAKACGWSVPYLVDNNPGLWHQHVHGLRVEPPDALSRRDFDLVLVASYAGKRPLFEQLDRMGFSYGNNYAYFLDPVSVGHVRHQVTL